ncbi:MAG: DNA-directed RNA polymerase subunit alpha C-terminal domain-containing protein [Nanoarchaeota archaeon]
MANIPIPYTKMAKEKKLSTRQRRNYVLAYLTGLNMQHNALSYARYLNDPLIDFYSLTPAHSRFANAAHLYLVFNDREVQNSDLVNRVNHATTYLGLNKRKFSPVITRVVKETNLEVHSKQTSDSKLERLVSDLFGRTDPYKYVKSMLLDRLEEVYNEGTVQTLFNVRNYLTRKVDYKIKYGAFGITDLKQDIIIDALEVLKELDPDAERLISVLYGLDEKTGIQIASEFDSSLKRIDSLKRRGFSQLKNPEIFSEFNMLAAPLTDQEIVYMREIERIKKIHSETSREKLLETPIDHLRISSRLYRILKACEIKTAGDIIEMDHTKFLSFPGVGHISLEELKNALSSIGLNFKPRLNVSNR